MKIFKLALLAWTTSLPATAQIEPLPNSMWEEGCTIERAEWVTLLDQMSTQGARRQKMLEALSEFENLVSMRDWEEGVPMINQMSAAEATRYEVLGQRINNGQLVEFIEGKRERDLKAISGMANIADKIQSEDFIIPEEDKNRQIYLAFLVSAAELMPMDDTSFQNLPSEGPCNLENSLSVAANQSYRRATDVYGWEQVQVDLEVMSKKYGGGRLDQSKMSAPDLEKLQEDILPVIEKSQSRLEKAQNLLRLATIEKMSKQMLHARRLDQYDAPGDIDYMGTNWERIFKTAEFTKNEIVAGQILYQLNEFLPADIVETWSMLDQDP